MRTRHVCSKCGHNHILLVEKVPDSNDDRGLAELHIATVSPSPDEWWEVAAAGALQAAVCRACGYTELYAISPETIPVDGRRVREVIGPESSPYR